MQIAKAKVSRIIGWLDLNVIFPETAGHNGMMERNNKVLEEIQAVPVRYLMNQKAVS